MYKFGLKLWSTNINYIDSAIKLYELGLYSYIELFAVPNSYKEFIKFWQNLKIPYIIHAAHSMMGLNLAKRDFLQNNILLAQEAFDFAESLDAKYIIFHPGINGDIKETCYQINKLINKKIINVNKILIENKPYYGIIDNVTCVGSRLEEIEFVIKNTGVGFCFDIAHAIYSANSHKENIFEFLDQFKKLKPKMYHLADGGFNGVLDEHKNIGLGNFDFKKILNLLPQDSFVTLETKKNFQTNLSDFEQDVSKLKVFI
ncbi:sugar phosphate isomerase/epimerase [Candidatus Babeliales bacterium]|nr:sugar phosphate isomerase/epimerase [Candidatus Babeliales bacterium]